METLIDASLGVSILQAGDGRFRGALQVAVGLPAERVVASSTLLQQLKLYAVEMDASARLGVAAGQVHRLDGVSPHDAVVGDVRQRHRGGLVPAFALVAVELVDDDRGGHPRELDL